VWLLFFNWPSHVWWAVSTVDMIGCSSSFGRGAGHRRSRGTSTLDGFVITPLSSEEHLRTELLFTREEEDTLRLNRWLGVNSKDEGRVRVYRDDRWTYCRCTAYSPSYRSIPRSSFFQIECGKRENTRDGTRASSWTNVRSAREYCVVSRSPLNW
jgi:hypothetical protein